MSKVRKILICSVGLGQMAFACSASAQAVEDGSESLAEEGLQGIQDIIVTAQKRRGSVQDTPVAITAIGGEELSSRQISDFETLAPSLPNVNFGRNVGFARIAIRGLGFDSTTAGQEGRVAYHTDGVYISRPTAQLASFFDVDRIEVIRGPQGTLYGRNATAGAVNVVTNDPSQTPGGYAKLTLGNFGLVSTEGAYTGSVSDKLSARIAFQTTDRGGYGRNLLTDEEIDNEHSFGLRGKLKFEPSSATSLVLSVDYSRQDDNNFVYHYMGGGKPGLVPVGPRIGGRVAADPRDTFADDDQINERRFFGASATFTTDLGFADLTSITAYRDSNTEFVSDADGTDLQIGTFHIDEIADQLSQELRLHGSFGNVEWLVGGFYFDEEIFARTTFDAVRAPNPALLGRLTQGLDFRGTFATKAYAAFGQVDFEIADGLKLSGGIRFSHESKKVDQKGVVDFVTPYDPGIPPAYILFQNASANFDSTTPKVSIEYRLAPRILAYATYSKGFKSGGFALSALGQPVQPESLTDYEGGLKADIIEGRLRLNVSAFKYDYNNLQVQRVIGGTAILVNAASAKVKGLEAEFIAEPVDRFQLSGNVSWLKSRFTEFMTEDSSRLELGMLDLSGNRLPQAPNYVANLAAQYRLPISSSDLTLRVEGNWTGRVYFSAYNRPEISQPSFAKFNFSIRYDMPSGFELSMFVRNLADKRTISTEQVSGGFLGFPIMGAYDPPRTVGAALGYRF